MAPPPVRTATPLAQPPAPTTAGSSYTHSQKPFLRPKSPQTLPEMDVDVGRMSSGLNGQGDDHLGGERDAGSEEILKQLEKGLPKWEGFGDAGWMDEADHVSLSYALSETFKVFTVTS
jgi:chromatin structure-remodeling complex subunit RSC1/2